MRLQILGLLLIASVTSAFAEQRGSSAHQHGHSALNMAIEGSEVLMELFAPGVDVIGFEHAPANANEWSAVKDAVALLSASDNLFRLPGSAGCTAQDVDVQVPAQLDEGHDNSTGDDTHADEEDGDHGEFRTDYVFSCNEPQSLTYIDVGLFAAFPGAQELEVTVVTEYGATRVTIGPDDSRIDLPGAR